MTKLFKRLSCLLAATVCGSVCVTFADFVSANADEVTETRYTNFFDSGISTYDVYQSETISYTRKEETYVEVTNAVPYYMSPSSLTNNCGSVAGATLVGYYDKYYEELVPNFTSYYPATGIYKRSDSTHIPAVMNELYTLMRTNVDDVGVNEPDCLNGLQQYFTSRNRSISYTNLKSSGVLNQTAYLNAINNNKPALLFCNTNLIFKTVSPIAGENKDVIVDQTIPTNHIVVAFGLYTVKYYNGTNNFRTDVYLRVAAGLDFVSATNIKIGSSNWLNSAYITNVS